MAASGSTSSVRRVTKRTGAPSYSWDLPRWRSCWLAGSRRGGHGLGSLGRGGGIARADDRRALGQPDHVGPLHQGPSRWHGDGRPVLPGRVAGIEDSVVSELREDIQMIHEKLDLGLGPDYQSRMPWSIRSILGRHTDIRNARVLRGPNLSTDLEFEKKVENTETYGVITELESDDV